MNKECDHDSQTLEFEGKVYWVCLKCGLNQGEVQE